MKRSYRRITAEERIWAAERVKSLKGKISERDYRILKYFVVDGLNSGAIQRLKDPYIVCIGNRNKGKPLSQTSILAVVYKYFPQFANRIDNERSEKKQKRIDLLRKRDNEQSPHIKKCAFCGGKKELEEHHMIPLSMGGTNDDENLVYLCNQCHKMVTSYQRQLLKRG